jgi:hypothetical protein
MKHKKDAVLSKFVTSVSSLTGIEDGCFLKNNNGYIGGLKVPGIDIFNLKQDDFEAAILAFGNAVLMVTLPTKYVFIGCKPNYGSQMANIARHELIQKNPFRKHLLERQRAMLEYYQEHNQVRYSFVLFFSPKKEKITNAIEKYAGCLSMAKITAVVCERADLEQLYTTVLKGETDNGDTQDD